MSLKLWISISTIFAAQISSATIVANYSKNIWSNSAPTRIIVASKGLMFASVGYQQAQVFKDLYPEDQILFITNKPTTATYSETKQKQLKKLNFKISEDNLEKLSNQKLISILFQNTSRIRSLDIISHNGVELGPWLEDTNMRLDFKNYNLMSSIKSLFDENAWARIQGCNSGWNVAPALSKAWGIPVMGSFTSTSFYTLNKNGSYELYSENKTNAATTDTWSFKQSTACPEGACITLRPENAPYHYPVHKSKEAAWLSFLKPVCDSTISDQKCQKALAESLISTSGVENRIQAQSNKDIYKLMVIKSVCGAHTSKSSQTACIENIKLTYEQRQSYLPYSTGTMLNCSGLRSCQFKQESIDLRKNKILSSSPQTINEYIDHAVIGLSYL